MEEKRYLNLGNKIGYGLGSAGFTTIYMLMVAFVMFYATDTVGLNPAIVGTLIMVSKLTDGISDVFMGHVIDKTKTKLGKARPWMLIAYPGLAITGILLFSVPVSWGSVAKYAYFFIWYTMFNSVFFTADNLAYATLTALITRNTNERIQIGSLRFLFSTAVYIIGATITINSVETMGGGTVGWRNVAIVYSLVGLALHTVSVFSVKELEDENEMADVRQEKISFKETLKLLFQNKYFVYILIMNVLGQVYGAAINTVGVYYCSYVLGDSTFLGKLNGAANIPMMIGLAIAPFLAKKLGSIYKLNMLGFILGILLRVPLVFAGYSCNMALIFVLTIAANFVLSPYNASLNALTASTSEYTYKQSGKRIDGAVYSCDSFGAKIGAGVGSAATGLLLQLGGYIEGGAAQPKSALDMITFMYFVVPLIGLILHMLIFSRVKVEKELNS